MDWVQLGIWGDSLVHGGIDLEKGGWVNRLRLYLANRGLGDHAFNLGLGGANSADILERIEAELRFRTNHIDDVLVSVGINDLQTEGKRLSCEAYRENLAQIVARVRAGGKTPYLVSITPCRNTPGWQEYFTAARDVASAHGVRWIDLSHAFPLDMLVDNVHPNGDGHEGIFQAVKMALMQDGVIPAE